MSYRVKFALLFASAVAIAFALSAYAWHIRIPGIWHADAASVPSSLGIIVVVLLTFVHPEGSSWQPDFLVTELIAGAVYFALAFFAALRGVRPGRSVARSIAVSISLLAVAIVLIFAAMALLFSIEGS